MGIKTDEKGKCIEQQRQESASQFTGLIWLRKTVGPDYRSFAVPVRMSCKIQPYELQR